MTDESSSLEQQIRLSDFVDDGLFRASPPALEAISFGLHVNQVRCLTEDLDRLWKMLQLDGAEPISGRHKS